MLTNMQISVASQDEADRLAKALIAAGQYHYNYLSAPEGKDWYNKNLHFFSSMSIVLSESGTWSYSTFSHGDKEGRTFGDAMLLLAGGSPSTWPVPRWAPGTVVADSTGDIHQIRSVLITKDGLVCYASELDQQIYEDEIRAVYEKKEVTA